MADNSEAFNNLKKEIRSILIPHKNGCTLFEFRKDYKQMLGRGVPYHDFNYQDDLHLLQSIPDTVRISQFGGEYRLMAVADENTKHIQMMVSKQKQPKQKPTKSRFPPRRTSYMSRPTSRQASFSSYSAPYSGKMASHGSYATPVVSKPSSQSVWSKPSYSSQTAQFGSNAFTRQPVPSASVPAWDSQPAPVVNKPVPIPRQSVLNKPSFGYPATAASKPTVSNTAVSGWAGHRKSDVPPRFRAPVNTNILPPEEPTTSNTAVNGSADQRQSDESPWLRASVYTSILPLDVECRIVTLVQKFTTGLRISDFLTAYTRFGNEMFSWHKYGFQSLKQCLESIPDLALKEMNNDHVIFYVDKSSTNLSPVKQIDGRQISGKVVGSNFSTEPYPAPEKDKANEVFQFSASWNGLCASSNQQTKKQDVQSFNKKSESYNLKSSSPVDEKSQYYQDSAAFKKLSSEKETLKKKADVLDTFELSSTSSLGITDKIKNNMREIMSKNKQGIFATKFPEIYEKVTGFHFDLHSLGFNDLTELVDSLPDIFRRKRVEGSRKDWIIVPPAEEVSDSCSPSKCALQIECSIQNIKKILQGFPEGIQLDQFLNVYSTNLTEPLYLLDLGFSCIDDFLLSIAERVPLIIETVDGIKTVLLTETEEVVPPIDEVPTVGLSSFPLYGEQESIPFDAASPDCQYRLQQLPADMDLSKYVPVYTSNIFNPGHLYVQLDSPDTTGALDRLYDEIDEFYYGAYSYEYQMKRCHLKEGAMCAALWPQKKPDFTNGDNKWYRARVISHILDSVKVFYVDYGTIDEVPLTMLRYLKVAYTKLPAQAIKARLAYLKPPNNAPNFSPQAQKRMLELCMDINLMAKVEEEKDGVLFLCLCDTNGETDIYINDVLYEEGLAVRISDSDTPPFQQQQQQQQLAYPPHQVMQAQCFYQMFNSLSLTMSPEEVSNTMQQLTHTYMENPLVQQASMQLFRNIPPSNPTIPPPYPTPSNSPPADESEIFQDDDDLFEEFYQKASSVSKRFVKRVRTSDGYFFHVLIVDGEAFVSSGDVSMLIWNDKSPQYLLERLQTRDKIFPSHCISEKGNEAMFRQFEKFHVKGTQSNGDSSSIVIYPLKSAIPILNMYGHPSVELRHKITMEIETFNPLLPAWQEVSDVEIPDSEEDVFRAVTDDDKLKRLCIHDLAAMKEGIRQKRNLLVRKLECDKHDESTVDELDKLESLLKRVVVRIEQINLICATYS